MAYRLERYVPAALLAAFAVTIAFAAWAGLSGHSTEGQYAYLELVFLLMLAVAGHFFVAYLRQPTVMALMLVGIAISPAFLSSVFGFLNSLSIPIPSVAPDIIHDRSMIQFFAQLGAVFLLFGVGLRSRIENILSRENTAVAVAGVLVPFVLGFAYAFYSGGNFAYSMFLGAALTATSVGVTVAVLKEAGLLQKRFAQVILGAAVIDDVLGLLVLAFVINVPNGIMALPGIALIVVSALVFVLGGFVAGRYFLAYMDRPRQLDQARFLAVLAFMIFYAYIAEFIGLSAIVGAFLAGIILNRSEHIKDIEAKMYGLEMLFTPIFFITLGMLVDVNALAAYAVPILAITALAIAGKLIACGVSAWWSGLGARDSLLVGIGMAPRGEVALIIASLGLSASVLDASQYTVIAAMALLTTLLVPPVLNALALQKR
jgi:Kef-type K+ transport system membrane component KefB